MNFGTSVNLEKSRAETDNMSVDDATNVGDDTLADAGVANGSALGPWRDHTNVGYWGQ